MPDEVLGGAPGATPSSTPSQGEGTSPGAPDSTRSYFDPTKHIEKAEFTRLRQRDADERRQFEETHKQREAAIAQREQQILQAAEILQQRMAAANGGQQDPFSRLRDLPYVDGSTFADTIFQFRDTHLQPIVQAIAQRDKALQLMYKQLMELHQQVNGFRGKAQEADWEGQLRKVLEASGLPDAPWAIEFLKDVYLSHEGEDLSQEFPNMVRERWAAIRKAVRDLDRAEAQRARALPMPGGGGSASPSKPLDEGYKSPKDRAEELWGMIQGSGESS